MHTCSHTNSEAVARLPIPSRRPTAASWHGLRAAKSKKLGTWPRGWHVSAPALVYMFMSAW